VAKGRRGKIVGRQRLMSRKEQVRQLDYAGEKNRGGSKTGKKGTM
jgi:hypothetical protein